MHLPPIQPLQVLLNFLNHRREKRLTAESTFAHILIGALISYNSFIPVVEINSIKLTVVAGASHKR